MEDLGEEEAVAEERGDKMLNKIEEYSKKADEYDMQHVDKCYKWEVLDIKGRIREFKKSAGNMLLDVGCGTGGHLRYLQNEFDCTGIDFHKEMLKIAKKKLGNKVKLKQGDMSSFNLSKQFDIILCLYSVLNYSGNYIVFRKTIKNFYKHLKNGGVLIIEPDYTPKIYKNFTGKNRRSKNMIMNEIGKWNKIMKEEGFKVKYFYRGLHQSAKGLYILTK